VYDSFFFIAFCSACTFHFITVHETTCWTSDMVWDILVNRSNNRIHTKYLIKKSGHLTRHIICIARVKFLVTCICGPLFVTCCYWGVATMDYVSTTQIEDIWSETKPSLQIYQQTKLYPISIFQYWVRNCHLNSWQVNADRHVICLLSFDSDRIIFKLLGFKQTEQ
jgi:hypothetical protein